MQRSLILNSNIFHQKSVFIENTTKSTLDHLSKLLKNITFSKAPDSNNDIYSERKIIRLSQSSTRMLSAKLFPNIPLDNYYVYGSRIIHKTYEINSKITTLPLELKGPWHVDSNEICPVAFSGILPLKNYNSAATLYTSSDSFAYKPGQIILLNGNEAHCVNRLFYSTDALSSFCVVHIEGCSKK